MATCAGLVGSATLKDLAPSEKAKVTQLMHKIVEQGQQLQAVREQCIQERRLLQEAEAIKQELQEQNAAVARDNTSLRAKLTHAFALLKTYQHKVRVLHAALQTGQATPADGQCQASLAGTDTGRQTTVDWGPPGLDMEAREHHVWSLSPIKEDSSEGDLPASFARGASRASHTWPPVQQSLSFGPQPPPQAQACCPMSRMGCEDEAERQQGQQCISQQNETGQQHGSQQEPLTLLARALVEAQSELFSNWRHLQQQQRGQQELHKGATASGHGEHTVTNVGDREASDESSTVISCSKENFLRNEGHQFMIDSSSSPGMSRGKNSAAAAIDSSLFPSRHPERQPPCTLQTSSACQPAQVLVPSSSALGCTLRQELQQQQHGGAVAPYAFGASLLDIVEDVEGLLAPSSGTRDQKLAISQLCCLGSTLQPQVSDGRQQGWSSSPRWEAYEENDLLSLIADIE